MEDFLLFILFPRQNLAVHKLRQASILWSSYLKLSSAWIAVPVRLSSAIFYAAPKKQLRTSFVYCRQKAGCLLSSGSSLFMKASVTISMVFLLFGWEIQTLPSVLFKVTDAHTTIDA